MSDVNFQRLECQKCVWYLTPLEQVDCTVEEICKKETQNEQNGRYKQYQLKIDTKTWSTASQDFSSLLHLLRESRKIYDSVPDDVEALISFRLLKKETICKTMVINPARHRCKVCVHDFVPLDTAVWQPLPDPNKLIFACATQGQIVENARQAQNHFSRLAHYHDGDGTFYAQTSIRKPLDPPGQSLLKQAIRVGRGEKADGSDSVSPAVLHPRFQTFTTERYPTVPPLAVPTNRFALVDKRLRQDNARHYDCIEDEYDVDIRQNGSWYDQHFSGNLSREAYFIDVARLKGTSKFEIVANVVDSENLNS